MTKTSVPPYNPAEAVCDEDAHIDDTLVSLNMCCQACVLCSQRIVYRHVEAHMFHEHGVVLCPHCDRYFGRKSIGRHRTTCRKRMLV